MEARRGMEAPAEAHPAGRRGIGTRVRPEALARGQPMG